jgi:hypothetical protein
MLPIYRGFIHVESYEKKVVSQSWYEGSEYIIEHPENPTEQIKYRLITSLLDIENFPAELLVREYHQRWEVENTIDELKIHLLGRKTHVRSQKSRELVQEVYGWLLGHWSVRMLMFQAATNAEVPPLRLSFTGTLRVIRRALPKFQRLKNEEFPLFLDWLTVEILDTLLPEREPRNNPRVVKKPVSKFRSKNESTEGLDYELKLPAFGLLMMLSALTEPYCIR